MYHTKKIRREKRKAMKLFDTHCHLDFDVFEPARSQHFQRGLEAGVERLLLPSVGPDNWQKVKTLAQWSAMLSEEAQPEIFYALGFHPYFLTSDYQQKQSALVALLDERDTRCVAIGECGLDDGVEQDAALQEQALNYQLDLAKQYQLPVILHNRRCHNRLIQLVKAARLPKGGVIHAFSGSYEQGMEWIRLGFYLGVGGTITYPRAHKTRQAISRLPLGKLLLETDAPDMPIFGFQGKLNTPAQIIHPLNELSLLHNQTKQTIASQIWKNSNSLFSICE
ncbi:TPA: TatD family deoxyribonuclease [Vibrio vulnificus]|nr:TatD family deoxyribonuclease [Vibrio vulnificus]